MEVIERQRLSRITVRELDIIHLLKDGITNREMGERLCLKPLMVRNCIGKSLTKFEARNHTELLAKFMAARHRNYIGLFR